MGRRDLQPVYDRGASVLHLSAGAPWSHPKRKVNVEITSLPPAALALLRQVVDSIEATGTDISREASEDASALLAFDGHPIQSALTALQCEPRLAPPSYPGHPLNPKLRRRTPKEQVRAEKIKMGLVALSRIAAVHSAIRFDIIRKGPTAEQLDDVRAMLKDFEPTKAISAPEYTLSAPTEIHRGGESADLTNSEFLLMKIIDCRRVVHVSELISRKKGAAWHGLYSDGKPIPQKVTVAIGRLNAKLLKSRLKMSLTPQMPNIVVRYT
jgi:hypothetical protein